MRCGPLLALVALAAACGGGESARTGPRGPRCGATCAEIDVRGPVAAHALGRGRVAILVGGAEGALLSGVARTKAGRWNPRSLELSPIAESVRVFETARRGDDLLVAHANDSAVVLSQLADGALLELGPLGQVDATPSEISIAIAREGPVFVSWTGGETAPAVVAFHEGGTVDPISLGSNITPHAGGRHAITIVERGLVLAHASDKGVQVAAGFIEGGHTLTETRAHAVAAASDGTSAWIAWAGDEGVQLIAIHPDEAIPERARVIDAGERTGDPAHLVGAGLSLLLHDGGAILGYQDQTSGVLVTARAGEMVTRQAHADARWTRAFDVTLVAVGDHLFALDVTLRARPELRGSLLATPL